MAVFCLAGLLLISPAPVLSDENGEAAPLQKQERVRSAPDTTGIQGRPPQLRALRVEGKGIEIDGHLYEMSWKRAPAATGFVQFQPDEGAPASERTEARVLYGERALYVGLRAFEKDPSAIEAQLTRRDQQSYSDWVYVAIDSYNDKRTAFQFSANPKGIKRDAYLYNDTRMDYDWDAVWEVGTAIDELGWTAEFRIPYSQLRFPRTPDQTWGIQFGREIARTEETCYWAPLSAQEYATVSKFGTLRGLNGVRPPRRLELMPYAMAKLQRTPGDTGNPLFEENDFSATLGLDVKYGITGDLTLDIAVNPDFGPVEADPAEVNLTAFETFFPERRPFFIEGADIFDFVLGYGPTGRPDEKLFYSRRIGREPRGDVDPQGGYMEMPDATTIQIAEKLSGKTASGWTVGLLHAATAEEEAHIITGGGQDIHEVVEPSTQYGLVRLQKDFRGGRSALGMISTGVFRQSGTADEMDLHTQAVTGGLDFRHRFGGDNYMISGYFIGSQVSGTKESIALLQQAPSRYMHRPDADHVTYDPTRTSLEGATASLTFGKVAGAPWQYGAVIRSRTPGFEVNDMGFARRSDLLMTSTWLEYRQYVPTRYFRRWSLSLYNYLIQTHGYERTRLTTDLFASLQFLNYWSLRGGVYYDDDALSTDMLRGGPAFKTDDQFNAWARIGTDARKVMQLNVSTQFSKQWESDTWSYRVSPSIDWRPSGRIQMSVGASYARNENDSQWVDWWWNPKSAPITAVSTPYIFGHLSQETIGLSGRLEVAFTPNLSFQLYVEPFVSAGNYDGFKQVVDPKADRYTDRVRLLESKVDTDCYGYSAIVDSKGNEVCIANPDFNYKQFRSNAVLRWEYLPGSTLFVVWSQGREHLDQMGRLDFSGDFGELFGAPSDDVFLVKVSYWF